MFKPTYGSVMCQCGCEDWAYAAEYACPDCGLAYRLVGSDLNEGGGLVNEWAAIDPIPGSQIPMEETE